GLLYRFIPNQAQKLHQGGKLQALALVDQESADTRNWEESTIGIGKPLGVRWVDLEDVDSPNADLRFRGFADGAARFARGEGMWYGNDAVYFACTNGGPAQLGQIWKLTPADSGDKLELFVESSDHTIIENADNLTVEIGRAHV